MNAAPASCLVMTIWARRPTVAGEEGKDGAADHAEDVADADVREGVDQILGGLAVSRRLCQRPAPMILGSETVPTGASPIGRGSSS